MGVPRMTILCLCREEPDWKLIPGYADAFRRRGMEFFCVSGSLSLDATLDEVLRTRPDPPSATFHFESAHSLFPTGLEKSQIPTIRFHPDTYAFTPRRIGWSMVFDHAAVFHPGYVEQFAAAGPPAAFLPHHAVRSDFFRWSRPAPRIRSRLGPPDQRLLLHRALAVAPETRKRISYQPEWHAASPPSIPIPPTHSQPAPHANSAMLLDKVFARQ